MAKADKIIMDVEVRPESKYIWMDKWVFWAIMAFNAITLVCNLIILFKDLGGN